MNDSAATLERKLATLPDGPGVYLWKDDEGGVLYVGKAKRLSSRVRSYVNADPGDSPKNTLLRRLIADVGRRIESTARLVPGAADVKLEQATGLPMLVVTPVPLRGSSPTSTRLCRPPSCTSKRSVNR